MNSLVPRYRALAERGVFLFGLSVLQHEASIKSLAREVRASSMLDYGCGRGDAYNAEHLLHERIGIERPRVQLYDPAFSELAQEPSGRFDLVVCSDVLEHVPEVEVDWLVARLFAYAERAVWASVCCRPAKKAFPDGMNLHVTVRPLRWWRAKFDAAAAARPGVVFELVETT